MNFQGQSHWKQCLYGVVLYRFMSLAHKLRKAKMRRLHYLL